MTVPTATDTACIPTGSGVVEIPPNHNDSVGAVFVSAGSELIIHAGLTGGSLTINNAGLNSAIDHLMLDSGRIAGTFSVPTRLEWFGGSIGGPGMVTIPVGATVDVTSPQYTNDLNGNVTLVNYGTISWASGGWRVGNGALLDNHGTINMTAANTLGVSSNGVHNETDGTIVVNPGAANTMFVDGGNQGPFQNDGTLELVSGTLLIGDQQFVSGGTLRIDTGATVSVGNYAYSTLTLPAGGLVTGGGTLQIGSHLVANGNTIPHLELDQGAATAGGFTATGTWTWKGGATVGGTGTVTVAATAAVTVDTSQYTNDLNGNVTLVNYGTISWASGGWRVGNGALLDNHGTINMTSPDTLGLGPNSFHNQPGAVITRSGPGTTTTIGGSTNGSLADDGTIDVESGTLAIQGDFSPAATSTLHIHITGPTAGTEFGQLQVAGAVALTGALQLVTSPGYTPAADAHLVIVQGAARTGSFTSVTGQAIPGGKAWLVRLDPTSVALEIAHAADTTTALASTADPSVAGQAVTYTATVTPKTPGAGAVGGTVTFRDQSGPIATCAAQPVDAATATATCAQSYASPGTHAITAGYSGDPNFTASTSAALNQVVNKADTTTALASSADPSVAGQAVTYTATVAAKSPGAGSPGGTVAFIDGTSAIGACAAQPVNITTGKATCTLTYPATAASPHAIAADYSGDANFTGSQGTLAGGQSVAQAATTTTLTQSANPAPFGQPVTLTATIVSVAPGSGSPNGTVQFKNGTANLGAPAPVVGGQAKLTVGSLLPNQTITAIYSSDPNFLASQSQVSPAVSFSHPVVTGTVNGDLTLSGGSWLLDGATVRGKLLTSKGAFVAVVGSTVKGNLTLNPQGSDIGGALSVCGTTVAGNLRAFRANGFVLIGDPGDDGCAANTVSGGVALANNTGGVEMGHNKISKYVTLSGNSGNGAFADDTRPEVEANSIDGALLCSGDTPAASNDGQPNTVRGIRRGECKPTGF